MNLDFRAMKDLTHLYFDLDHTLWDFQTNSRETLEELYLELNIAALGAVNPEEFIAVYEQVNDEKWALYRSNTIDKKTLRNTRFVDTLKRAGIHHAKIAETLEEEYVNRSPHKSHLLPGALEVLHYLDQKYELHIITNGFAETQATKMSASGLTPFFKSVITSEEVGASKPDPVIFRYALKQGSANRSRSAMVGDNLAADIRGARRAGMHQVYFNPGGMSHRDKVSLEIRELRELCDVF